MARPFADTNEPLPPELNRTLAFCRCSSHCCVGSNSYFSLSCLSGDALKSHIPSSAAADAMQPNTLTTANDLSVGEISETVNIEQHKMLTSARQLRFDHPAIKPRCGSARNRSKNTLGISDTRFLLRATRQPTAAIAASEATKKTTIVISKKVNVPRVNTFKAAAIVT